MYVSVNVSIPWVEIATEVFAAISEMEAEAVHATHVVWTNTHNSPKYSGPAGRYITGLSLSLIYRSREDVIRAPANPGLEVIIRGH